MPRWTSCNISVLINSCQRPPKPHGVSEGRESELNKSLESSLRGDTVGVELFGCITCYRRLDSDKKKTRKKQQGSTDWALHQTSISWRFFLFICSSVRLFVCFILFSSFSHQASSISPHSVSMRMRAYAGDKRSHKHFSSDAAFSWQDVRSPHKGQLFFFFFFCCF